MKRLLIIMSHREASDIFIRHWPLWAAHKIQTIVFAPADSIPRIDPNIPLLLFGRAEHHGTEAVRRFKWLLQFLGSYEAEEFFVAESDSFCLDPNALDTALTDRDFYGNIFPIGNSDPSFVGTSYVHPPFGITHAALNQVNALNLPETTERGFWDRYLGLALEKVMPKLKVGSSISDGTGFSRNTIEPEDRAAAVAAVEQGAVWVHGCKDEATLTAIKAAYARRVAK